MFYSNHKPLPIHSHLTALICKPGNGEEILPPDDDKLTILKQPADAHVEIGKKFSISAEVSGEGLRYQWYYKDPDMSSFTASENQTAAYAYTMKDYMCDRQVYCVITDRYGDTVTTEPATITHPPRELQLLAQPQDVCVEASVKYSVRPTVKGDGLRYQWYYKDTDMEDFAVSINTKAAYSYTMQTTMHRRQVYCVITDRYGNTVTTDTATISLPHKDLKILSQPTDVYAAKGVKYRVAFQVQGTDLSYQWYYKAAGTNEFMKSINQKAAYAYTMQSGMDGRQIYCVITDEYGEQVTTDTVTLHMVRK